MTTSTVLAAKFHIPPPPPELVRRPHLIERLNEGLQTGRKLALLCAPAGFGKTTLVSHWVAECEWPVAWLSLDERDNDLARFLSCLVAALQPFAPSITEGLADGLTPAQPQAAEAVLTVLLNAIAAAGQELILVLDDFHVIDAKAVDEAMTFALEHLPPQLHIVIATREDPHLPLARLRARGQLNELRVANLRFSRAEAGGFLNQAMGLSLSAQDIAFLEERTEGWVAGLKLAALSLRDHEDVSEFIQAFAGDHRYIVDFLVEEVLQRQPAAMRSFLLQTSILERMRGPLCDAVCFGTGETPTGRENGQARLEALERGNFFVVALDERRHWYRYHHLFADVLQAHLRAEHPDWLATLHRRASEWYEQNGSAAEAIHHALSAMEHGRAADLIELAAPGMRRSRQEATLLGWLRALPGEVLGNRPVLAVTYAHVLLASGELQGVEELLQDAERWSDAAAEMPGQADGLCDGMIVVDAETFRRLPGMMAIARAALGLAGGDVPGTMAYARRALDLAPEDDHLTRGASAGFLGLAYWTSGDLDAAHGAYAEGMAALQRAGNLSDVVNGANTLAAIRLAQGRLRDAMYTYERGLQLATAQAARAVRGAADMHVGMCEVYRERNDLKDAMQHLMRSMELGEHTGFAQNQYRRRVALARIRQVQGDFEGALDLLDDAQRLYRSDFSPNVRPIAALKARAWLAQGRLVEALDWAREQGLSAADDVSYLREFEHITLARVLLARYKVDGAEETIHEAMVLLERLLKAAEEGQRTGSVMEILVLQALAHQMLGKVDAALTSLQQALALTEPEGYVRLFVDEGAPMAVLLKEATKREIAPGYVRHLLTALGKVEESLLAEQPLMDPLSRREREVLRLLGTDMSGPELARELMVSLATTRTHIRNIYGKLGVNSRRAAVRRAQDLDLL